MIKLPKDVSETLKKISDKGFIGYVIGGCVRDSMLGLKPLDWDMATDAKLDDLLKIFPKAKVLSQEYSVIRLDFTNSIEDETNPIIDIATFREEIGYKENGAPSEVVFVKDICRDLKRRDFTFNGMADNPQKGFLDPFGGRKDLKAKTVRVIGEPKIRFQEDPTRILRAIRFVAEKGFKIDKKTYEEMEKQSYLLKNISKDKIRDEFCKIIVARFAGEGLRLLRDTGAIDSLIGEPLDKIGLRKKELYNRLAKNIDDTYPVLSRRLGLFYTIFGSSTGKKAIDFLEYDSSTRIHLLDAIYNMDKLSSIKEDYELKDFMSDYGLERYMYMNKLAQDKVVAYKVRARRVNKMVAFVDRFEMMKEPIFLEDLVIDGNDLENEVGLNGKEVGDILDIILIEVHRKPYKNNRKSLLELARKYKGSPLKIKMRRNKWLRRLK